MARSKRRPTSQKDQHTLWTRAGNCCSFRDPHSLTWCRTALTEDHKTAVVVLGEMAHIEGEKPSAARYRASMTDKERNAHENLILLCRPHHKVIDDQRTTYTVETLRAMKNAHEAYVKSRLKPPDHYWRISMADYRLVEDLRLEQQSNTVPPALVTLKELNTKVLRSSPQKGVVSALFFKRPLIRLCDLAGITWRILLREVEQTRVALELRTADKHQCTLTYRFHEGTFVPPPAGSSNHMATLYLGNWFSKNAWHTVGRDIQKDIDSTFRIMGNSPMYFHSFLLQGDCDLEYVELLED